MHLQQLMGAGLMMAAVLGLSGCGRTEGPTASTATAQPAAGKQKAGGTYAPTSVTMELVRVSEHVYYVQGAPGVATDNEGFISNAGVVITGAGVVVFDALGTPSLAQRLLEKIRGITDQPVVKVVVSHYHADHIYGLQVFKDLGAEIIAPAGAAAYLDGPQGQERLEERRFSLDPWVNEQTRLVAPDRYLKTSERMRLGEVDLEINVVGAAHSDGDLTLYVATDRVLFSGDIIFEGRIAYVGDADTKRWLQALEQMETSRLVALIPGHGPAARDPNRALAATRQYLAFLRQHMRRAVDEFISFDEIYEEIDWGPYKTLPAFDAANRRNAYQVFLSIEQEVLGGG